MADPYASREGRPAAEAPAADSALTALVVARGGLPATSCAGLADASSSEFVAVVLRDEGLLPPIARITPEQAVMLLAGTAADAGELERALSAALDLSVPLLLLKEGLVAGPAGRDGALVVDDAAVETLLEAALGRALEWELDPDFGYEVATGAERLGAPLSRALCPRLTYADHDRVYEHAELVVAVKRERHARVSGHEGAPEAVLEATGWPIEPTGQDWKD